MIELNDESDSPEGLLSEWGLGAPPERPEDLLKPDVVQETPDNCDSCNAPRARLIPIQQTVKRPIGNVTMVVGYLCEECEISHLYRIMPGTSTGLVLGREPVDIPSQRIEDPEDE